MHLLFWNKKQLINPPIKFLLIVSGGFMFAYAMLTPIYALFVKEIGGGIAAASASWAVFYAVAGILTFITGRLESKMKETELAIAWSQIIVCIAYIFCYFAESIFTLYVAMIILGVGNAIFWPAFHAIYTKHVDGSNSVFQWSLYDGLAYLIPALGAIIGGWIAKNYGFDLIFIIMAILAFLCGILILLLPRKIL